VREKVGRVKRRSFLGLSPPEPPLPSHIPLFHAELFKAFK